MDFGIWTVNYIGPFAKLYDKQMHWWDKLTIFTATVSFSVKLTMVSSKRPIIRYGAYFTNTD